MTQNDQQWTVQKLLDWTRTYLQKANVESARLCSEILLAQSLGCKRMDLYLRYNYLPTPAELAEFRALVKRAVGHEPVAYLTGVKEFYSLDFEVSPAVLIPRPETEIIVEQAINEIRELTGKADKLRSANAQSQVETKTQDLDKLQDQFIADQQSNAVAGAPDSQTTQNAQQAPSDQQAVSQPQITREKSSAGAQSNREIFIWDICTGSGCVPVAIAHNEKSARIFASDICADALAVAARNVQKHKLDSRVKLFQADLAQLPAELANQQFDIITSNPPYVGTGDQLGAGVEKEPAKALFAGADGLDLIRNLVLGVAQHLKPGGLFIMEFGQGQADDIRDIVLATGKFAEPAFIKDFQDIERTMTVRKL